jgi:hypothetical protein
LLIDYRPFRACEEEEITHFTGRCPCANDLWLTAISVFRIGEIAGILTEEEEVVSDCRLAGWTFCKDDT